jgi:dihydrofolate reductase
VSLPRCSVFVGTSLDGFIARPDGGLDWLAPWEQEEYGYRAIFEEVDTLVVGRRTYDVVLGFDPWPYDGKRVVVLTHAPPAPRHGETFRTGRPAEVLGALGAEGARRVHVDGGAVVSQFLDAGLVADLTVSVVPVVLGAGTRLFQGRLAERRLALLGSSVFPSGLVQLRYGVVA